MRRGIGAVLAVALAASSALALATPDAVRGQQAPDRAEVDLVFDFSASILQDVGNRNRFATALDEIAARVDEISGDLQAGDTTVSFIQFAGDAQDYPRCTELRLLGSPEAVGRFADCLRSVAAAYRRGVNPVLTRQIGTDTNYVAAMEQAAEHLPAGSTRPTLILFTDGKHDVAGVPPSAVLPARDRLFGDRSPFALLPVGMGLDPAEQDTLKQGLDALQVVRDMPACVTGSTFDWPQTVFTSPADAGNAVAVALQNATCTFTVAPTPTPSTAPTPSPTPGPVPNLVRDVSLDAGNASITVSWVPPATTPVAIVDYHVRCRAGDGDWVESTEGVSLELSTTIEGLTNGLAYECQVASVGEEGEGRFTPAPTTASPVGPPAPPAAPSVTATDGGAFVSQAVDTTAAVTEYRYECSADGGTTWSEATTVLASVSSAPLAGLANGVEYVCRAYAVNAAGISEPSPLSGAIRPCGSPLECNPVIQPILIGVGALLGLALLGTLIGVIRAGPRDYVVVVVDVAHTRNLGHGRTFNVSLVRAGPDGPVTDVERTRSGPPDFRIRYTGGERFRLVDADGNKVEATAGRPVVVFDAQGHRHEVVLWAFATPSAAAAQAGRR